jgi:hypothetical protein
VDLTTRCFPGEGCGHIDRIRVNGCAGDAHCVQTNLGFWAGSIRVYDRLVRCEYAQFHVTERDEIAGVCVVGMRVAGINHVAGSGFVVLPC